jgi:hypothetical protein
MSGFELQRLGMLMEPQPGDLQEVEGVLNPAAARGPDGELYLFPRLVAVGTTRASALPECGSMERETRKASSVSASLCNRKPTMSVG